VVVKIDTEEVTYQKGTMDRRKGSKDVASLTSMDSIPTHQTERSVVKIPAQTITR